MLFCSKNIDVTFRQTCFVLLLLIVQPEATSSQQEQKISKDDYDTDQYTKFQHEKIFNMEEICNIQCESRPHTMCKTLEIPICDKYEMYQIYEVGYLSTIDLKELLINGHNGLRNRIASKMNVANIVEMTWDDDLAHMTVAYFMQCNPFEDDPCTGNVFSEKESQLDYYEKDLHKWVVQNRYNVESEFFPNNFIEHALQAWYFEKDMLQRPKLHYVDNMNYNVGTLKGENNFTHLAYPLSFRVGCSLGRIEDSYSLICNYYPFYRSAKNEMIFISSEPTSNCPIYFPLADEYFTNICTDNIEGMFDEATALFALHFIWICIYCVWFALLIAIIW